MGRCGGNYVKTILPPHERVAENRRFGARGRLSPSKEAEKTELKPGSEYVYGNSLIARNDYKESYSRYGYASGYVTGNREYYGQDVLGSTMLVTNGAAGVVQRYAYDAYGNNYEGSFSGTNSIGYNGKRYDGGTGWYDYGFRDYDSRTGRFTTVDPIRDGMNWYAYCGGDPINYVDLWGLSRESDKGGFFSKVGNVFKSLFNGNKSKSSSNEGNNHVYSDKEIEEIFDEIQKATLQNPNDIISKFNKDHPNDTIDETTLAILFTNPDEAKKILMERKELHTDLRYILNENAPKTKEEAIAAGMIKLPWYMSLFHNPLKNEKYVSVDGHMEGVYDKKTGESDINKLVMATFNLFDPNTQPGAHKKTDVDTYGKWGN